MTVQIQTNREALAAIADGAAVYLIGRTRLRPASRIAARDLLRGRIGSMPSPFAANPDGDLLFLGWHADTISRNCKRLSSLVDA